MNSRMSRVTSLLCCSCLRSSHWGLSACATDRPVKDTEEVSDGPTVYGQISVSVDHVSVR